MNYLESAIELIKLIEGYGYEAYIVGGAVRDYILRIDLYDIDITTNMPIDFSLEHFECTETGSAYQSIVIRHMGYNFEVTNYRKDISYIDHRHPVVERALSYIRLGYNFCDSDFIGPFGEKKCSCGTKQLVEC